jgi:Leucine-rich repeat (LRR) protein
MEPRNRAERERMHQTGVVNLVHAFSLTVSSASHGSFSITAPGDACVGQVKDVIAKDLCIDRGAVHLFVAHVEDPLEDIQRLSVCMAGEASLFMVLDRCDDKEVLTHLFFSRVATDNEGRVTELDGVTSSSLPTTIGNLRRLVCLDCNSDQLRHIPETVGHLHRLSDLCLRGTGIACLPEAIGGCRALRALNLADCAALRNIPDSIGYCTSMVSLDLSGSAVTDLPGSIANLQLLEDLDCSNCQDLEGFPDAIGRCGELTNLDLSESLITTIPTTIGECTHLLTLDLSFCYALRSYHLSLGLLKANGCQVRAECCPAAHLIGDIATVQGATALDFSDLMVFNVPDTIGTLLHLETLAFGGCKALAFFPDAIKGCLVLTDLDLSGTAIQQLSLAIGALDRLRVLNLNGCRALQSLPETVGVLRELQELNCYNCGSLETLPLSISELAKLQRLNCHECRSLWGVPAVIVGCVSLVLLDLRNTTIPPTIQGHGDWVCQASLRGQMQRAAPACCVLI